MAIKAYLPTLDGLDDSMKALYKESDGGFIPDVESVDNEHGVFGLMNNQGLKNSLTASRNDTALAKTALSEANAKLAVFDKYSDKTADDFASAFDALKNGKTNVDVEAAVNQAKAQFNDSLKIEQDKSAKLMGDLLANNHRTALNDAINKRSDVLSDSPLVRDMVLNKMLEQSRIADDGAISVVDAAGVQRMSSKIESGAYMAVGELLNGMIENPDFAVILKPSGAAGSGTVGSSGGGTGGASSEEKVASGKFEESDLDVIMDAQASEYAKLNGN